MSELLKGKRALVTAGAQGIGLAISRALLDEGCAVAVHYFSSAEAAEALKAEYPGRAGAFQADLTVPEQAERMVGQAVGFLGGLDVLVNNAGWSHRNKPVLEVTEEEFDRVFAVNVKSIFHFCRAAIPRWRAQGGGAMLNIGSTAGIRPRPGLTWYNATKGAVNLVSRSLAVELAPEKIRVNCIAPVAGETPLLATFMGEDTPEKRAAFTATVPLGRLSTPRDIANAALYLCSDEADFITGVILEVDGGRTI